MWRAGYSAAFAHPKSLETMGQRESAQTESIRQWLLAGTTAGKGIADLVQSGGARFEDFERALLTVGEESGRLDDALRLLGDFYMKKHQLMQTVQRQMTYPMFTALAACFIAPLKLVFVGRVTEYCVIAFGSVAVLLAGAGALVGVLAAHYGRKPPMARARMARALATAVAAGLTLPRALRLAADASASPAIRAFVRRQSEKQLSSRSIAASLDGCPLLTPDFAAFVQTAESTGDFTALTRLAELYEDGFR